MEYESCGSATKHRTANEIDIVKLCVCGPAHLQSNGSFELVMPASRETTSWMPRVSHKFFESHPHWRHVIGILALHCGLPHLTEETLMLDFKQLQKSQLMPWIRRIREFRFKARNGQKKNNFILPTTRTNGSLSLNRRIAAVDGTLDGYRVTYRHVDKNLRKFSSWLEGLASQAYVFPFFKMNQDSIEENFKYLLLCSNYSGLNSDREARLACILDACCPHLFPMCQTRDSFQADFLVDKAHKFFGPMADLELTAKRFSAVLAQSQNDNSCN